MGSSQGKIESKVSKAGTHHAGRAGICSVQGVHVVGNLEEWSQNLGIKTPHALPGSLDDRTQHSVVDSP